MFRMPMLAAMLAAALTTMPAHASEIGATDRPTQPVTAPDFTGDDRSAIREVISRQIDAFLRDDAATAFAATSARMQAKFETPDEFMAMVRRGYEPIYRPRSKVFAELRRTRIGVTQYVRIIGPDDLDWLALFTLDRDEAGEWKISGCWLARMNGQPA